LNNQKALKFIFKRFFLHHFYFTTTGFAVAKKPVLLTIRTFAWQKENELMQSKVYFWCPALVYS